MAFAYVGNASASTGGALSLNCNRPAGTSVGDFLVAVYAFAGVAAGSGPWIIPNNGQLTADYIGPTSGWLQACWQTPSGTGVGVEVWVAIHGSGATQNAKFAVAHACTTVAAAWSGEYNPSGTISGGPPSVALTAQVTGNQPAAPSVPVQDGDLIVACGADLMGVGGFGAPSGFTNRVDVTQGGAGTVEATIADRVATVAGPTGLVTFPNNAAAGTTIGTTATLAIRPAPTATGVGVVRTAAMPEDLDLPDGYRLVWAAIDPTTGADVAGVTVHDVSIFGTHLDAGGTGGGGSETFTVEPLLTYEPGL